MGLDLATGLRHQAAMDKPSDPSSAKQQARLEREAKALRANLARRKSQARAKAGAAGGSKAGEGPKRPSAGDGADKLL